MRFIISTHYNSNFLKYLVILTISYFLLIILIFFPCFTNYLFILISIKDIHK